MSFLTYLGKISILGELKGGKRTLILWREGNFQFDNTKIKVDSTLRNTSRMTNDEG